MARRACPRRGQHTGRPLVTGHLQRHIPLRGPLHASPAAVLAAAGAEEFPGDPDPAGQLAAAQLDDALSRLKLGSYDHTVAIWLRGLEPQRCATIASWLRRARQDGMRVWPVDSDSTPTADASGTTRRVLAYVWTDPASGEQHAFDPRDVKVVAATTAGTGDPR